MRLRARVCLCLFFKSNTRQGPKADEAVRQAIVEALDEARKSHPEVKLPHQVSLHEQL